MASLPVVDRTDNWTLPVCTYMTCVPASPCVKIVSPRPPGANCVAAPADFSSASTWNTRAFAAPFEAFLAVGFNAKR